MKENEIFIPPTNLIELDDSPVQEQVIETIPSPTDAVRTKSADPNRIFHYYVPPFSTSHNNGCGQAAMATVLTYWGKMKFDPNNSEILYRNPSSNPDIVGGIFGTSWERVLQVFKNYGMKAYGQNEPRLRVTSENGKYEMLCNWVNARCPVAVILGNGELNLGAGAHWGVVVQVTSYNVTLANYGNGYYNVNLADFMKAWMAYGLPGVHFAAVYAQL